MAEGTDSQPDNSPDNLSQGGGCSVTPEQDVWGKWRNIIGFWLLGLCNNYAYVVMLSAAHDILDTKTARDNETISTTVSPKSNKLDLDCNPIGTGAVLLADIIPTLVIKLTAPLYMQSIPYSIRIAIVTIFAAGSFLLVAFAEPIWLGLTGVVFASVSAGFGEVTFLALTSHFDKNTVAAWSSGTGASGILGSLSYAGLKGAGVSDRDSLLIMLVIPALLAFSYYIMLLKPHTVDQRSSDDSRLPLLTERSESDSYDPTTPIHDNVSKKKISEKFKLILPLLQFMIPLGIVYYAEYFINQGLQELLYFKHIWLDHGDQYRWYQVIYQLGVFISRSSVILFTIEKVWIFPILQVLNIVLLFFQIFYQFLPSIWIVFAIILYEGLLGGAAYANTFYVITKKVEPRYKEYSMGIASLADSAGISLAGATALPVHNLLCKLY